jgi:hypothetical protein
MSEKNRQRRIVDYRASDYEGAAARFSWLPNYVIKIEGGGRIEGGNRLSACIKECNLHLLEVPDQILYKIPERHNHLTDLRDLCIGRYIEGKQGKNLVISRTHVEQLRILIKKTGVGDLKWRNLVHTPRNTIALIDTESFWGVRFGLAMLSEWNKLEVD